MREEAVGLYRAGVFYPSFAFRGEERLDKKNVYNYELEGTLEWAFPPVLPLCLSVFFFFTSFVPGRCVCLPVSLYSPDLIRFSFLILFLI